MRCSVAMEHNDNQVPTPSPVPPTGPVWAKRPAWAWAAMGGGLTLFVILTATAVELGLRPISSPSNEAAEVMPTAPPPPDTDLLATAPAPLPPPIIEPKPMPPAEAPAPFPLPSPVDTTAPQSARVPMRAPQALPARPASREMPRGKDG